VLAPAQSLYLPDIEHLRCARSTVLRGASPLLGPVVAGAGSLLLIPPRSASSRPFSAQSVGVVRVVIAAEFLSMPGEKYGRRRRAVKYLITEVLL